MFSRAYVCLYFSIDRSCAGQYLVHFPCDQSTHPEALPDAERLRLAVHHALEIFPSLLVDTLGFNLLDLSLLRRRILALFLELRSLGLESLHLLRLFVLYVADPDVDVIQVSNGVLDEFLLVSVEIETNSQYTVLLSPVSEVVHANDVPAGALV